MKSQAPEICPCAVAGSPHIDPSASEYSLPANQSPVFGPSANRRAAGSLKGRAKYYLQSLKSHSMFTPGLVWPLARIIMKPLTWPQPTTNFQISVVGEWKYHKNICKISPLGSIDSRDSFAGRCLLLLPARVTQPEFIRLLHLTSLR